MAQEDLSGLKINKAAGAPVKQRKNRSMVMLAAVAVLIVLAVLFFRGMLTPAVKVSVATVSVTYPSQAITLLNASGYVVAQRKAAVASKTTGRLVWIGVEEGSRVKQGQVLARLENDDSLAARSQAEANLGVARANLDNARAEIKDAEVNLERQKKLLDKGFATQSEYDLAELRFRRAQAAVAGAEASIKAGSANVRSADVAVEYANIRAPFDAVVLTKNADIGDIITPLGAAANAKAAVVTIADLDSLQVEADVSESNLRLIKAGQPCEIQLDALPENRFRGEVHMIVPTADRSKASVMMKIKFLEKDPRVLPEMSAKVAFLSRPVTDGEKAARLTVSNKALTGGGAVFVVKEGRVEKRVVKPGQQFGDQVEILDGLRAGEKIVLDPPKKLRNGSPVAVEDK